MTLLVVSQIDEFPKLPRIINYRLPYYSRSIEFKLSVYLSDFQQDIQEKDFFINMPE